jgi:hypothetical protein
MADHHTANVLPMIREIQCNVATSLHQIADSLNARGITTARGGLGTQSQSPICWLASDQSKFRSVTRVRNGSLICSA